MTEYLDSPARDPQRGNASKVDAYKWTMVDKKGELLYINKESLHVDHNYQRDKISSGRVLEFASRWSWIACGALIVSCRKDGTLWVVDGQHRKLAADKRTDISDLPCVLFENDEQKREADGFVRANTHRGAVRRLDTFRAQLVAEDEECIAVNEMVIDAGYEVKRGGPNSAQCVGALLKAWRRDAPLCAKVFALCVDLCDGDPIKSHIFEALFFLEEHVQKSGDTICGGHNRQKLLSEGTARIEKKINEAKVIYEKSGPKVWAKGVLLLINTGRRTRHIEPID